MDFLTAMDISASGLTADRTRINTIAMNLANAKTTRTPYGGPYRRRTVVQAATDVDDPSRFMSQATRTRTRKAMFPTRISTWLRKWPIS